MAQFVGYLIDHNGESAPIATGSTAQETAQSAIRRKLLMRVRDGLIEVQQRDDMPSAAFAGLTADLHRFFQRRGLEMTS